MENGAALLIVMYGIYFKAAIICAKSSKFWIQKALRVTKILTFGILSDSLRPQLVFLIKHPAIMKKSPIFFAMLILVSAFNLATRSTADLPPISASSAHIEPNTDLVSIAMSAVSDGPLVDIQILDENKTLVTPDESGAANFLPNSLFYLRVKARNTDYLTGLYSFVNNAANDGPVQLGSHASVDCNDIVSRLGYVNIVCDFGPYNVGTESGPRPIFVYATSIDDGLFKWNGGGSTTGISSDLSSETCPYPNVVSELMLISQVSHAISKNASAKGTFGLHRSTPESVSEVISQEASSKLTGRANLGPKTQSANMVDPAELEFEIFSPGR